MYLQLLYVIIIFLYITQSSAKSLIIDSVFSKYHVRMIETKVDPIRSLAVEASWNVMAHMQKPDFIIQWNVWVHLNRRGRQFSRLLAAKVCASVVVMQDTPCSEVVWRVLATHSIRQFPLHFPSCASLCAITFQVESTPDVTRNFLWQLSLDSLCIRPKRNSLFHTTTLNSTPKAAGFVSSWSWGTKSKAFAKSIIIVSNLALLSTESSVLADRVYLTFTRIFLPETMLTLI